MAATIGLAEAKTNFSKVTAEVNATGSPVTALKNNRPWVMIAATPGWASSARRLDLFWSGFCRRGALFSGFRRASKTIDSLFRHFGRAPQVAAKSATRLPAGLLLATRRLLGGCRQNVGKAHRFDFGAASPGLGAWCERRKKRAVMAAASPGSGAWPGPLSLGMGVRYPP